MNKIIYKISTLTCVFVLFIYMLMKHYCYIMKQQDNEHTFNTTVEEIEPETTELETVTEIETTETETITKPETTTELETTTQQETTTIQEVVTTVPETEEDTSKYIEFQLNVNNVEQNPELPTGCEVTALTTVLNYMNYNIDKLTLADYFLPKGAIGTTHPDVAFVGNPRNRSAYGANAPVIVYTANSYFNEVKSEHKAHNISGNELSDLTKYLYDGYPVIIWATINMSKSYPGSKWYLETGVYQWKANLHCLVLVGFTEDKYILADPLKKGLTYYDKDLVETRYNELGNQAVVIY